MSQLKVESLLGDFDSPGAVGPLLGEHEAVALVQLARGIQSGERREKNALVPGGTAKFQRDAHELLAESRAAVGVVDDEKTQACGVGRIRAVDGDAADDFIVLGGDPEAVALRIVACEKVPELACNLRLERKPETPVAGVIAAVQLDQATDTPRDVSADMHWVCSRRFGKQLPSD